MTITATTKNTDGQAQAFVASHLDDAGSPAAAVYYPGFTPLKVEVENETDRIKWTWRDGNAAATCVQEVAAGTRTIITSAGVTVGADSTGRMAISFAVLQNKQYRVNATA